MEFFAREVGPLTVMQWGIAIAIALVAISALQTMIRTMKGGESKDTVPMRCPGCGWHGSVSRFHRTCPKCGDQITPTRTLPSV